MSEMESHLPPLYGSASTGKVKVWKIWVEGNGKEAVIITEYGYDEGEVQQSKVKIAEGKNLGRSNETTPFEQACLEARAKWEKKKDKKYVTDKATLKEETFPLPMLAHDFNKRGKDIEWPAFIQPKLNGIRCLARKVNSTTVEYISRGGKVFDSMEHLTPHLLKVMKVGDILDGELYTKKLTFQEIVSAVKKCQEQSAWVDYWIYDVIQADSFADRLKYLEELQLNSPLVMVPTRLLKTEDQMKKFHHQMVNSGYEGAIIRNLVGDYRKNHRSPDLQKYKEFIDEEFKIVGGKQGVGKDLGAVTFICETEEGKRFDARPRGTYGQRRKWWQEVPELIGKQLTVRYQTRSDDNIPIFPVGITIRDYE